MDGTETTRTRDVTTVGGEEKEKIHFIIKCDEYRILMHELDRQATESIG